jgi:hypothetical protein
MKSILDWLKKSNRYKHLIGGVLVGMGANDAYCAAYAGIGIAAALEFKDWQWGGMPDLGDFLLTVAGVVIGYLCRVEFLKIIGV